MTADSYSPTKEQTKDFKMVSDNNKDAVLEVDDRHFLFKCMKPQRFDQLSIFLAEVIGTALLMFLGCMGCATTMGVENSHFKTVLNFGLTVMTIVTAFGCVSGGHLNPSITLSAYVYKSISLPMVGIYIAGQMIGTVLGFGILKIVTPADAFFVNNSTIGLCTTVINEQITPLQGVIVEFIITSVLVWVNCGFWDPRNAKLQDSNPLKLGFVVTTISIAAGPWTGASMNPARSFGPAFWNGNYENHWVYWIAPLTAGVVSAYFYKMIFRREVPSEKSRIAEEIPLSRERTNT